MSEFWLTSVSPTIEERNLFGIHITVVCKYENDTLHLTPFYTAASYSFPRLSHPTHPGRFPLDNPNTRPIIEHKI